MHAPPFRHFCSLVYFLGHTFNIQNGLQDWEQIPWNLNIDWCPRYASCDMFHWTGQLAFVSTPQCEHGRQCSVCDELLSFSWYSAMGHADLMVKSIIYLRNTAAIIYASQFETLFWCLILSLKILFMSISTVYILINEKWVNWHNFGKRLGYGYNVSLGCAVWHLYLQSSGAKWITPHFM